MPNPTPAADPVPFFDPVGNIDLLYVDNWSIGLDLAILVATVPMVVARAMKILRPARVSPGRGWRTRCALF